MQRRISFSLNQCAGITAASFLLLTAIADFAAKAHAASIEELYEIIDETRQVYRDFEFPKPEDLLDDDTLKIYQKKMGLRECRSALLELISAFGPKYPHLPHPASGGILAWRYAVSPNYYPEAVFCQTENHFQEEQRLLEERSKKAQRLPQSKADAIPFRRAYNPVWGVANETISFLNLALADYPPAYLKLAQLSEVGEVIRLTPVFNYFALARAKLKGLKDPDLDRLLAAAESKLDNEDKTRLASRIETGLWPRAEPIVLD